MCAAAVVKVHVKVNGSANVVEKRERREKKKERLKERPKAFFLRSTVSAVRLAAIISELLIFLNLSATGDSLQASVTIPVRDTKMIFADGPQHEM